MTRARGWVSGFLLLLIFTFAAPAFARHARYYHPAGEKVFCHQEYCFDWAPEYGQSEWVSYLLTREQVTEGKEKRSNDFRADPEVPGGTPSPSVYHGSGYDQGHLVPAADMKRSRTAMSQTFFTSNMSPQKPGFNRGIWKFLEKAVRDWAVENDSIYVTTGPVLKKGLPEIGSQKQVVVPELYYKIVLVYKNDGKKAIAFVMPNAKSYKRIMDFAVNVDSVERLTGINFFPDLPDSVEKRVEAMVDTGAWPIKNRKTHGAKGVESKEKQ